ncbi:MAG: SDR family NAD(P)-dependent oxidoreductase [Bacteroidota bacterium]|nr:SDR family NAD(P)-dependent oxidoreductase [Bacteroidota bacterium]
MEISNNTILITGGTSGIGLEFARQLIALDNTVIITGRDQLKLEATKLKLPKVHTFKSDVSDPEAIKTLYVQVIKQFPNLNILINNAGEMRKLNLHDKSIDLDNITREIEINLSGPVRMVQQFLPHLQSVPNAAIMNVTSGIAFVPFPLAPIYGATKSGLQSYTRSLRSQLKKDNIKVFELVAPGSNTPLNDKFAGDVDPKTMMEPDKLVTAAIKGLKKDKYQIFPGIAFILALLGRFLPGFIFNQMSKIAERSFAGSNL